MPGYYVNYKLGKAATTLVKELVGLKPGETFVIIVDTESDPQVVNAVARAAFSIGAKPMVIWMASPLGVGKAADLMLSVEALAAALKEAAAWVEFNNKWLLYSTPFDVAMKENKRLRYLCLFGMDADMMVRYIGRVDYQVLKEFEERITEMTKGAEHVRMATPAGEDVEFDNDPARLVSCETAYADTPGPHMLAGQIGWSPVFESINGVVVFDGSIVGTSYIEGLLGEPVNKIKGGNEATEFEDWLMSFADPMMLRLAHICYGFNPDAKLTGNILEDEKVWGATEWGLSQVGPMYVPPDGIPAPSHTDGICLNTSVWLDGRQIINKGEVIEPGLRELAKKLGKG